MSVDDLLRKLGRHVAVNLVSQGKGMDNPGVDLIGVHHLAGDGTQ